MLLIISRRFVSASSSHACAPPANGRAGPNPRPASVRPVNSVRPRRLVPARTSLAPFPHPYQIAGRRDVARLMVAHERAESFGELVLGQPGACPGLPQTRVERVPGHNLIHSRPGP